MNTKFSILRIKEVTSTNDFAKDLLLKNSLPNFYTILTEKQTKGRGQRENTWYSENAKNLLFSIITKPTFIKPTEQFYLSKSISLGIINYLNSKKEN
ncbi:MAG: biotin--[acetyl-CoA-carboxylase] ligase, partial [Chlorobi bacterium]|nr:biotin--[acetyl-CoA-carboxylase] ligase [Chlorobiota bacterium]